MRLPRPRRLKLGPEGRDQQHRHSRDMFNRQIEQLARGRVGPMQILEDHQYGLPLRQTSELSQQRLECLFLLSLWREVESGVTIVEGQRQKLRQQRHVTFGGCIRRKERLQLVEPRRRRIVAREAGRPFELADEREQGAILVMRRAEIAQSRISLALDAVSEGLDQSRFPNPRLCRDQHHTPRTRFRLRPSTPQQLDFLLASDERGQFGLDATPRTGSP